MHKDESKAVGEILHELSNASHVQIRSSAELAAHVSEAAQDEDEKRTESGKGPLRRRTDYSAARNAPRSLTLTPWQIIHAIGLGAASARQGAGRGLAEHWGSLRYIQALEGNQGDYLQLSSEGRDLLRFYKATQSGEIGTGFASLLAEKLVRSQYPDHSISVIPADVALKAGWTLRSAVGTGARPEPLQRRPHFFVEAWQPGRPSKVLLVSSKGTHSSVQQVHRQLSTASAHVESVHIGPYGTVPYMLIGTEIPKKEGLALHVLEAPGVTVLRSSGETSEADLDLTLSQENRMADVVQNADGGRTTTPGFQVPPESFHWLSIVLARTEAATLTAFTGGGRPTAQYLTKEQGQRHFQHDVQATERLRDAEHRIHDIDFVGTDHVYRLNGTRVEAFSGLEKRLYLHLHHGRVNEYRRGVHGLRDQWPSGSTAKHWSAVSIRADGTVLAIRLGEE